MAVIFDPTTKKYNNTETGATYGTHEEAAAVASPQKPGGMLPGSSVSNQGKPGYDVFGNPVAGTPLAGGGAAAPAAGSSGGTPSPYYPRYTSGEQAASDYLGTFNAPKSQDEIAAEKTKAAQAQIDSLNKYYDSLLQEQRGVNERRTRGTNALSTLTGLAGSTEAESNTRETDKLNQRDNDKINAERAATISGILSGIQSSAAEEARQSRLDAKASAEDVLKRKTERVTESRDQLMAMGVGAGATLEGIKSQLDPASYQYLMSNLGGGDVSIGEAKARGILFESHRNTAVGSPTIIGGHVIQYYRTPDGRVISENVALPKGVDPSADPKNLEVVNTQGGSFIFDKVKGTMTPIAGSRDEAGDALKKAQAAKINAELRGESGEPDAQLYAGLKGPTATAVRSKVSQFKSEPMVQNFATIQDGYNFAKSISDTTQNPADDQALIYSLAKALDPGSVVREGEYATAQKYAQSWIAAYGKGVEQALLGTGFLSETARKNIKKTIEGKYTSSEKSYKNLYKNYSTGINSLTGRADGEKFIIDYSTQGSSVSDRASRAGYDYNAMITAGYTDEQIDEALKAAGQ